MTKLDTSTEAVTALANVHQHVGDNPAKYVMGHPHHWKTADTLRSLLKERDNLRTKLDEAVALLTEASSDLTSYVSAEYPLEDRMKYPEMERKCHRDLELVRRIDAAIAKSNGADQ